MVRYFLVYTVACLLDMVTPNVAQRQHWLEWPTFDSSYLQLFEIDCLGYNLSENLTSKFK